MGNARAIRYRPKKIHTGNNQAKEEKCVVVNKTGIIEPFTAFDIRQRVIMGFGVCAVLL